MPKEKKQDEASAMALHKTSDGVYAVVALYPDAATCVSDITSEEFLAGHPDLEDERVLVVTITDDLVLCDPEVQRAREALKKAKFKPEAIARLLGLQEPTIESQEIPADWETAVKTAQLRQYAKIACPAEKVGRWSADACRVAVRAHLKANLEEHAADILPVPADTQPAPAIPDAPLPVPPPAGPPPGPPVPAMPVVSPVGIAPPLPTAAPPAAPRGNHIPAPPPPPVLG
jgi:hypothetical protein